jgi:hypothetical protein
LKGLVETFTPREISHLLQKVSDKAMTKGKQHFYKCKLIDGTPKLVQDSDGVMLPTPDEFNRLVMKELPHIRDYLDMLLDPGSGWGHVDILVHEISRGVTINDIEAFLIEVFKFEVTPEQPSVELALDAAIAEFYSSLQFDVKSLIDFRDTQAVLRYDDKNRALGIYLRIWEKTDGEHDA